MRGFHDLLRQKPTSLFILLGWSNLNDLPNNVIHVSGLSGKNGVIVKLT
jgi:hypothetical protein